MKEPIFVVTYWDDKRHESRDIYMRGPSRAHVLRYARERMGLRKILRCALDRNPVYKRG